MAPILKKRCKFTLRWLLDLENSSLEQNENFGVICFLSLLFFYLLFGCPMANFWLLLLASSKALRSYDVSLWALRSVVGPTFFHKALWDEFGKCILSFMESLIADFIRFFIAIAGFLFLQGRLGTGICIHSISWFY